MPSSIEAILLQKLAQRDSQGLLRKLPFERKGIDFCSNDYLGLSRSSAVKQRINDKIAQYPEATVGSTGSRLISGNLPYTECLEGKLAKFHHAQTALLFTSGYAANTGILGCIAGRTDTIILDELAHASMMDGVQLSMAKVYKFRHNDLDSLRQKLSRATGNIFVGIESVYSMDGDCAPLADIVTLCKAFDAHLVVDEAHGLGVFGERGRGLINQLGLEQEVFARIYTFGKAMGTHGAVIVGSEALRSYLINYARSFIYSTALPLHALASIDAAYEVLAASGGLQTKLQECIQYFRRQAQSLPMIDSQSAIQAVLIAGNGRAKAVAQTLQDHDIWAKAILSPTVKVGAERIRFCLHTYNTFEQVDQLISILTRAIAPSD